MDRKGAHIALLMPDGNIIRRYVETQELYDLYDIKVRKMKPIGLLKPVTASEETILSLYESGNYQAELKYDGFGCQSIVDGDDARFYARSPSKDGYVEYTAHLAHLFDDMRALGNGHFIGELIISGADAHLLATLHGAPDLTENLMKQHGAIQYVIYDEISTPDAPLYTRRTALELKMKRRVSDLVMCSYIYRNTEDLRLAIAETNRGLIEGVVIKKKDSKYIMGTKSHGRMMWRKFKAIRSDDVIVYGGVPGNGKYRKLIGALRIGKYNGEGEIIGVGSVGGFTDKERVEFTGMFIMGEEPVFVAEPFVIEIAYMEEISDTSYRHPRFVKLRPDKSPSEVTTEYVEEVATGITLDDFA